MSGNSPAPMVPHPDAIAPRQLVFISHATPEDNAFAQWLALKLTQSGYLVWCDVIKLIGGEPFWTNIDEAIRIHAVKFLFCATEKAIKKPGVLCELQTALEVGRPDAENFVVPIKLDAIPFASFPFKISDTTNIVRFDQGWGAGLQAVLKVLQRDNVPKVYPNGLDLVSTWWQKQHSVSEGVRVGEERHWSNIFPVTHRPQSIWYYPCQTDLDRSLVWTKLETPFEVHEKGVLCFANPTSVADKLSVFGHIQGRAKELLLDPLLKEGSKETPCILPHEAAKRLQSILRQSFNKTALGRGLQYYELANKVRCYWPFKGFAPQDKVSFIGMENKKADRQLVGYMKYGAPVNGVRKTLYWHYAVQFRSYLQPFWGVVLKSHIIFTEDGQKPLESKTRQHRLRRKQAKSWWNDAWRDRTLAMAAHLSGGSDLIRIPLSDSEEWAIPIKPQEFIANIAYDIVARQIIEELPFDADELDEPVDDEAEIEIAPDATPEP